MTYSLKFGKNKYGAVKTEYKGGQYDSKKEGRKAFELDLLVRAREIRSWDAHKKIELFGENGTKVCSYYIDFVVTHNDSTIEYIEIKSPITMTSTWRLKWKLMEDKYQDEIRKGLIKLTVEL